MSYCMYLRKSREDKEAEQRGEGETLARHRKTLMELAKRNNYVIQEIYEEVVSGDSIAARPQVQRMLNDVSEGKWDGVLVMELERLARGDTSDQGIIAKTFNYSSTLIITPFKTYNPSDEFDQEYIEFGLFMSRREYKTIKRRLHQGMQASCKEGNYIHNTPPYGYRRVKNKDSKGYSLEPAPGEAEIVKLIFEWYTNGVLQKDGTYQRIGTSLIANKLNNEYAQKPASGVWTVATISTMLRNEHYLGYIVYGKNKRQKVLENGQLIDKWCYHNEYQLYQGKHAAIITKETFGRAQELLAMNPRRPGKKITNPLAGVIKCGLCGRNMYRRPYQKRGQSASLICHETTCKNVSAKFELVESTLLQALEDWVNDYVVEPEENKKDYSIIKNKEQIIKSSENKLTELDEQLQRIYEAYEKGIYSTELFLERQKSTNESILRTTGAINSLNEEIKRERLYIENKEQIIPKARHLLEIYSTSDDIKLKNDLIKEVLENVVYTKTANGHFKGQRQDDFTLDIFPRIPKKQ